MYIAWLQNAQKSKKGSTKLFGELWNLLHHLHTILALSRDDCKMSPQRGLNTGEQGWWEQSTSQLGPVCPGSPGQAGSTGHLHSSARSAETGSYPRASLQEKYFSV